MAVGHDMLEGHAERVQTFGQRVVEDTGAACRVDDVALCIDELTERSALASLLKVHREAVEATLLDLKTVF